jgi:AhpD family alkylhydroperoxidase
MPRLHRHYLHLENRRALVKSRGSAVRFIEPVQPRDATGVAARVFAEIRRDFALLRDQAGNSPFMAHSVHPELLAALWSVFYETVLVDGAVRRVDKEAIATTISRINDCPFCVQAHALLAGVAGDARHNDALITGEVDDIDDARTRALVAWATVTRTPGHELLRQPPFDEQQAPEVIGTAVAFHYVNRIVEVLQGHTPMRVGPAPLRGVLKPLVAGVAGRAMRRQRRPGRTVASTPDAELSLEPPWARNAPIIARAQAHFAAAVERAGEHALPETARARHNSILANWDGGDPPLGPDWLHEAEAGLDDDARSALRLTLLAALAPYRIDESHVAEFARARPGGRDLLAAVAWGAFSAAHRISSWLAPTDDRPSVMVERG